MKPTSPQRRLLESDEKLRDIQRRYERGEIGPEEFRSLRMSQAHRAGQAPSPEQISLDQRRIADTERFHRDNRWFTSLPEIEQNRLFDDLLSALSVRAQTVLGDLIDDPIRGVGSYLQRIPSPLDILLHRNAGMITAAELYIKMRARHIPLAPFPALDPAIKQYNRQMGGGGGGYHPGGGLIGSSDQPSESQYSWYWGLLGRFYNTVDNPVGTGASPRAKYSYHAKAAHPQLYSGQSSGDPMHHSSPE